MYEFDARQHSAHVTECCRRSNPLQPLNAGTLQHRSGPWNVLRSINAAGGARQDEMSRDRVKVPSIERCFADHCYGRAQGCRVHFDRVASFIHHHPAAASTFETPHLVVSTFNIY